MTSKNQNNIIIHCSLCSDVGYEPRVDEFDTLIPCSKCKGQSVLAALRFHFPFYDSHGDLYKEYVGTACEFLAKHPNYELAHALDEIVQKQKAYFESQKNKFTHAQEISKIFKDCQEMIQKLP